MTSGMATPILNLNPHYTNERFRHAQIVWGHEEEGLSVNYSDRLAGWDHAAHEAAWDKVKKSGIDGRTPQAIQNYLTEYHGKPCELVFVMAGWNWATGYSYQVYGYRMEEEEIENDDFHLCGVLEATPIVVPWYERLRTWIKSLFGKRNKWDWKRAIPSWDWHDLALAQPPFPGWELDDEGGSPWFVLHELVRGETESRTMAIEFDDISEGAFYYRDWTSSGIPFLNDGEVYWSGFWFQLKTDAIAFQEKFGGVGTWQENFAEFQKQCNEKGE